MRKNKKKLLRRSIKIIHLLNSAVFIGSAAYIFVYALHKTGHNWLFIASLSGYTTIIVLFLFSFYLFAVYRGISANQNVKDEHVLTTSLPYLLFYNVSTLYGVVLVWFISFNNYTTADYLLRMSIGAVALTFLIWIVIDPLIGLLEMLLPSSRIHRNKRISQAQENRKREYDEKQKLLKEIHVNGRNDRLRWHQILESDAEELSLLISEGSIDDKLLESRVIEIGVKAFRIGGIECMRHLLFMTKKICERKRHVVRNIDYISIWWDGIGNWRSKWMEIELTQ
ncbi:MAG: hypothetical protein A2Y10_03135 [Planctomycetes bacterium GWF2_41_51]|nr:MAG: hypothetical protein A2Y10_03135 [Planctomycetes bacterium GWF2_41_51]HBG28268.1 hypothetical protein [Phycisphaerales bacterium]